MTPADHYRVKAGDLASLARAEKDPFQQAEYERLSLAFLRLADQADRKTQHVALVDPYPTTTTIAARKAGKIAGTPPYTSTGGACGGSFFRRSRRGG